MKIELDKKIRDEIGGTQAFIVPFLGTETINREFTKTDENGKTEIVKHKTLQAWLPHGAGNTFFYQLLKKQADEFTGAHGATGKHGFCSHQSNISILQDSKEFWNFSLVGISSGKRSNFRLGAPDYYDQVSEGYGGKADTKYLLPEPFIVEKSCLSAMKLKKEKSFNRIVIPFFTGSELEGSYDDVLGIMSNILDDSFVIRDRELLSYSVLPESACRAKIDLLVANTTGLALKALQLNERDRKIVLEALSFLNSSDREWETVFIDFIHDANIMNNGVNSARIALSKLLKTARLEKYYIY